MQDQMYNNQENMTGEFQGEDNTKPSEESTQKQPKIKEDLGDYVDFEEIKED